MSKLTRRGFNALSLSTLSLLLTPINGFSKIETSQLIVNNDTRKEMRVVADAWKNKEELKPSAYLTEIIKTYHLDQFDLTKASDLDFKFDNTFEVKGLVLAKSEAAFIAFLSEFI